MTDLPDHMIKIRDEAALEHSREWQHEHSDYSYQEGFNKCYEVMAEEFEQTVKPFALGGDYNKIPILQQQLAEKDQLLDDYKTIIKEIEEVVLSLKKYRIEKLNQSEGSDK